MALPSSGTISIDDIRTELSNTSGSLRTLSAAAGKSIPDAISEFYGYTSFSATNHINVQTWAGNNNYLTGANTMAFAPDIVWTKSYTSGYYRNWNYYNSVMGAGKFFEGIASRLFSNYNSYNTTYYGIRSFNSNGFNRGITGDGTDINSTGFNYIAYSFNAGSSTTTNTSGSINASVRANQAAGISIVEYTGNGSSSATVAHGLSSSPKFIILSEKASYGDSVCYHVGLGNTKYLNLDSVGFLTQNSNIWASTTPSSSYIYLGANNDSNQNGITYSALCFSEVSGFSKMGTYTGNGSTTGPVISLGFSPRFLMIFWDNGYRFFLYDAIRGDNNYLFLGSDDPPNNNGAIDLDLQSSGFQVKSAHPWINDNGYTYCYCAWD